MSDNKYKEIEADLWPKMSISELYEQLSILQNRVVAASNMNNLPMLNQLQKGIDHCNAIINEKCSREDKVIM